MLSRIWVEHLFSVLEHDVIRLIAGLAPILLIFASVRVLQQTRYAYQLGLLGGLFAWPDFVRNEFYDYRHFNSWIALNDLGDNQPMRLFGLLSILSVLFLLIATLHSLQCLVAGCWRTEKRALSRGLWPAFACSLLIFAAWYVTAVGWYVPNHPDGVFARLTVKHSVKRGFHFDETIVAFFRDGKVCVVRRNRRLFQYKFEVETSLSFEHYEPLRRLITLLEAQTPPQSGQSGQAGYMIIRPWNYDRWSVSLGERLEKRLVGVKESQVPKEFIALFNQAQALPRYQTWRETKRDICLGFCASTR